MPAFARAATAAMALTLCSHCVMRQAQASDNKQKEYEAIRDAVQHGKALPLGRVLGIASAQVPGDIIEIDLEQNQKDVLIYEIKILDVTGRVRKLRIDASNGDVLDSEGD